MHVSGYQSIDMHCFVFPVNFDGRLAISVPRNEQLFTKNGGGSKPISFQKAQIFKIFKSRHLEKGQAIPLEKSPTFLDLNSLANGIDNPPSNLT
jgi:hypothetical protein